MASLDGGDCGGVWGASAGAGPGGQTGRCLLGMGIGHAAAVLMLSRLRMEAKGRGEGDRGWLLARGSAMVAMVRCRNGWMGETSRGGSSPKGDYGGMDTKKAEKGELGF